jgi:hypothetical protein
VHNSQRTKHYPRARSHLTFRPVEGHFALTDLAGPQTERLTLVAALVWTYCDGRHDPEAIAEAVARELPEAGDDVRARVTAFLAQVVSQGMVS